MVAVNQCLCFHVECNQKGWSRASTQIHFALMNTTNKSMGYSLFQLKYGHSPHVLPDFGSIKTGDCKDVDAQGVIELLKKNMADAHDNILLAKISQASYTNEKRGPEVEYKVGNQVMLSTSNRRREFKQKGNGRVAKFMPHYDGPYSVINARPETSTYTLNLPDSTNIFPTFHGSQLRPLYPMMTTCFLVGKWKNLHLFWWMVYKNRSLMV